MKSIVTMESAMNTDAQNAACIGGMTKYEVTCEYCKLRHNCPVFYNYNNAACLTLREADSEQKMISNR